MYYGKYKSGCSIMGLFMGVTALAMFLQLEELLLCLPVIWFYSFCHVHNMKNMDEETFAREKDEIFFGLDMNSISWKNKNAYTNKMIAGLLISVGGIMVWTNLCDLLYVFPINDAFYYFLQYRFPQLVLGVVIVLAGVWLIRGKKAELEQGAEEGLPDAIFERDFVPRHTGTELQDLNGETVQEHVTEGNLPETIQGDAKEMSISESEV